MHDVNVIPLNPSGADPNHRLGNVELGCFRLEEVIGQGSYGTTYLATQLGFDREAVVKIAHAELLDTRDAEVIRRRFADELRAATRVTHENLVTLYTAGETAEGLPAIAMELVPGDPLEDLLIVHPAGLPYEIVEPAFTQLASALAALHAGGVVHRDLSPRNVMLDAPPGQPPRLKVLDFGVAMLRGRPRHTLGAVGTPRYMAPEQIAGKPIDGRIDIFALGVILFEMLCGAPPILLRDGDNEMAYVGLNVNEPPRKVSALLPWAPAPLTALVDRMMAKRREERPERMADVVHAIEELLKLPALQPDRFSADTVGTSDSVSRLLLPRPESHQRSFLFTLRGTRGRRYVVPALLGAVAALTLLVSFLLSRAGPEADLTPFGAPPRASVSSLAPPPDGRPPLPLSREDRPPPDLGAPTAVATDPSAGQDPRPSPRDEHSRRRRGSRRVRSTHGAKRPAAPE